VIHPYEWSDYRILLTVRNRQSTYTFLLNCINQEEFMQHWCAMWETERDRKISEMTLMPLNAASFDLLEPSYTGQYLLE
jgi:hypothetical protein